MGMQRFRVGLKPFLGLAMPNLCTIWYKQYNKLTQGTVTSLYYAKSLGGCSHNNIDGVYQQYNYDYRHVTNQWDGTMHI